MSPKDNERWASILVYVLGRFIRGWCVWLRYITFKKGRPINSSEPITRFCKIGEKLVWRIWTEKCEISVFIVWYFGLVDLMVESDYEDGAKKATLICSTCIDLWIATIYHVWRVAEGKIWWSPSRISVDVYGSIEDGTYRYRPTCPKQDIFREECKSLKNRDSSKQEGSKSYQKTCISNMLGSWTQTALTDMWAPKSEQPSPDRCRAPVKTLTNDAGGMYTSIITGWRINTSTGYKFPWLSHKYSSVYPQI